MLQTAKSLFSIWWRAFMLNSVSIEVTLRTQWLAQCIMHVCLGLDTTWSWSKDKMLIKIKIKDWTLDDQLSSTSYVPHVILWYGKKLLIVFWALTHTIASISWGVRCFSWDRVEMKITSSHERKTSTWWSSSHWMARFTIGISED